MHEYEWEVNMKDILEKLPKYRIHEMTNHECMEIVFQLKGVCQYLVGLVAEDSTYKEYLDFCEEYRAKYVKELLSRNIVVVDSLVELKDKPEVAKCMLTGIEFDDLLIHLDDAYLEQETSGDRSWLILLIEDEIKQRLAHENVDYLIECLSDAEELKNGDGGCERLTAFIKEELVSRNSPPKPKAEVRGKITKEDIPDLGLDELLDLLSKELDNKEYEHLIPLIKEEIARKI